METPSENNAPEPAGIDARVDALVSERGTLAAGEPHPMAQDAYDYIFTFGLEELYRHLGALSSCAIESNRLAEVCAETLRRVLDREPVSDRYLLGLAWYLRQTR